jgi:hypothetical protein
VKYLSPFFMLCGVDVWYLGICVGVKYWIVNHHTVFIPDVMYIHRVADKHWFIYHTYVISLRGDSIVTNS